MVNSVSSVITISTLILSCVEMVIIAIHKNNNIQLVNCKDFLCNYVVYSGLCPGFRVLFGRKKGTEKNRDGCAAFLLFYWIAIV